MKIIVWDKNPMKSIKSMKAVNLIKADTISNVSLVWISDTTSSSPFRYLVKYYTTQQHWEHIFIVIYEIDRLNSEAIRNWILC